MNILDQYQLEILERVRAGRFLGDAAVPDLRSELELMLALRLIEPSGMCPYRLTAVGAQVLAVAANHSAPASV